MKGSKATVKKMPKQMPQRTVSMRGELKKNAGQKPMKAVRQFGGK